MCATVTRAGETDFNAVADGYLGGWTPTLPVGGSLYLLAAGAVLISRRRR